MSTPEHREYMIADQLVGDDPSSDEQGVLFDIDTMWEPLLSDDKAKKLQEFTSRNGWFPYSEGELNTALASLDRYIKGTKSTNRWRVEKSVLGRVEDYKGESIRTIETLRLISQEDNPDQIDMDRLEISPRRFEVYAVLAKILLAEQQMHEFNWGDRIDENGDKISVANQLVEKWKLIPKLNLEEQARIWERSLQISKARLGFWKRELENYTPIRVDK